MREISPPRWILDHFGRPKHIIRVRKSRCHCHEILHDEPEFVASSVLCFDQEKLLLCRFHRNNNDDDGRFLFLQTSSSCLDLPVSNLSSFDTRFGTKFGWWIVENHHPSSRSCPVLGFGLGRGVDMDSNVRFRPGDGGQCQGVCPNVLSPGTNK